MSKIGFAFFLLLIYMCSVLPTNAQNSFVSVKGHQFYLKGKPYQYIGGNYWYGGLLSSTKGAKGRARLITELNFLSHNGIKNLRVLVGAEGKATNNYRVAESAQPEQGKYDDELLKGLDYFLMRLGKLHMTAVLYFTNNWEWSGGFGQYLQWNGYGPQPYPKTDGYTWEKSKAYITQFYTCDDCKWALRNYINYILTRTNSYTGVKYYNDPAIMAWELANEPRPMSKANNDAYLQWIDQTSAFIKSIDKNHLITTGSEGDIATDNDMSIYEKAHSSKNIDYLTIHIWPKNWGWFKDTSIVEGMSNVTQKATDYINKHVAVAEKLNKPLVIEEFGLPRDKHSFEITASTGSRDKYYDLILTAWQKSKQNGGVINGVNFWAVGGIFKPIPGQIWWKPGDDYMGDPPQEEQGINAVFYTDASTWKLIKSYTLSQKK